MDNRIRAQLGFKGNKGDKGEVGTPIPFNGTFEQLKVSGNSKDFNYIILNSTDTLYEGHWVYYDKYSSTWKDGGLYLSHYLTDEINNTLEDVINNQNTLERRFDEQLEELTNKEPQLPEIVDARKGFSTLGNVIKQKVYHFDTVVQMIACTNLENGDVVETSGYFKLNDGKGTRYRVISNITGYDETNLIELNNGFYALEVDTTKYDRPFRVLLMSDIHYTANDQYGVSAQERMQKMVEDIITEHNKQPIDLILILGDLSTDNMGAPNSSATLYGSNYVRRIFEECLYKLPCPVYALPGNHDSWSNEVWKSITGYDRQYSIEFDDIVFVMLDTFNDTALNGAGATYKGIDYNFLKGELEKFKDKKIFLCAHYFDGTNETEQVKNLIKNNNDIKALFCGHIHTYSEYESETLGHKIFLTGNYSYSLNGSTTIYNSNTTWGFRDLRLTENGIVTKSIRPAQTYVFNNETFEHAYTESEETVISENEIYKETASFHVKKDKTSNVVHNFLKCIFKHVYTLADSEMINPNSNLNNITETGVYLSRNKENTETLTCGEDNLPWNGGGFKLIVEKLTGNLGQNISSRFLCQTLRPSSDSIYGWFRLKTNNGTWTNWQKILSTQDFSKHETRVQFGMTESSSLWFYKSGKIVNLRVQIAFEDLQGLTSAWSSIRFENLIPEEYKPTHKIEFGYYTPFLNDNAVNMIHTRLETNDSDLIVDNGAGTCTFENVENEWIYGNVTYITD